MKRMPTKTTKLTPELLEEIHLLQAMPESAIDTTDIPEADPDNMMRGFRGGAFKPRTSP